MLRSRTDKLVALTSASLLSFGLATPNTAEACGGLFCGGTPVLQAEEGIIFDVDMPNNSVTAVINIVYQGSAEEFVWVLPLQTAPESIGTGSQQAFLTLQQLTTPQFRITEFENVGMCTDFPIDALAGTAEDSGVNRGQNAPPSDPGVSVVSRQNVGPYDTVVLDGTNPDAVKQWLLDNGFLVTDEMMEMVTPYIAKGDTLLALKLLNDRDVGEIKPIEVKMTADFAEQEIEACIPIRMTAMAANTDMPITAYVFTDEGRAIPQNFYHVVPNLLKIDWLNFGSNYRQLIADAVDEADAGHAFVTEYAGSPDFLEDTVYQQGMFDFDRLRAQTDLADFLQELSNQGLLRRAGMQQLLSARFESVAQCPQCRPDDFRGEQIDANAAVDEILTELIEPDQRAQDLFNRRQHFTRLFTMLDPEEMTVDPVFAYDPALEDVSNIHNAKMIRYCGVGGSPGSAGIVIVLEDGRRIYFDGNGEPNRSLLDAMPAAERVEQLHEGLVVQDNSARINELLDDHNEGGGTGCGCGSATEKAAGGAGAAFGLALLGLGLTLRRRRK